MKAEKIKPLKKESKLTALEQCKRENQVLWEELQVWKSMYRKLWLKAFKLRQEYYKKY